MDIAIFTAVRTNSSSGNIGFVADVRRLNVGITRAKSALWIVGQKRALSHGSKDWSAAIKSAEDVWSFGCDF